MFPIFNEFTVRYTLIKVNRTRLTQNQNDIHYNVAMNEKPIRKVIQGF